MGNFVTLDLHSGQTVAVAPLMSNMFMRNYILGIIDTQIIGSAERMQYVFIAPDAGASKATEKYAMHYGLPIAIVSKIRDSAGKISTSQCRNAEALKQDLQGKHGILIDDMADTMGTIKHTVELAKEAGLKALTVIVTHGVFSKGTAFLDTDEYSLIDRVYASDSLPLTAYGKTHSSKVIPYSTCDALAKVIHCIYFGHSLSDVFGL
jgi:phosphoribosylpyrophosphate synthetase